MLIQFRVENHRSLRDEQILSLVVTNDKAGAHVLRSEGLSEALVPVVAIYGANASGKSNLLAALDFMRRAVLDSQRRWEVDDTPHEPFLLSNKAREPSLYEVDIVVDDVRYRYGFQLSASRVEEEWLFAWPHGRKALWFEREGDRFEFGKMLHGENEAIRSLTRPNSLFLSAAAQNNHAGLLPIFRAFSAWHLLLQRNLDFYRRWSPTSDAIERFGQGATAERASIMQLIRAADHSILDVRVEPGQEVLVSAGGTVSQTRLLDLAFRHHAASNEGAWFPFSRESAGTRAMIDLAPHILDVLRDGGLLCVDELEASLHPSLALSVVRLFSDPEHNPRNAQLLFATHDTNLLGSVIGEPVLRRDQIWFTEKDDNGATDLYPLTDFHPRKEENLERGYLQGRYGAIPFLGDPIHKVNDGETDTNSGGRGDNEADDDRERSDGDRGT